MDYGPMRGNRSIGAVTALLLLAGCGGETASPLLDQNPRSITKDAFAAMSELDSVRMIGTLKTSDGRSRIDVRAAGDGGCTGVLNLERGRMDFIRTADATWVKGDRNFWLARFATVRETDRAIKRLGTSWATLAKDPVDFDAYCEVAPLLSGFTAYKDGGTGRLSKGSPELIGDGEAIPISLKGGGQQSTIWVSLTSPHRVVKIVSDAQPRPMNIAFEEYDGTVDVEAPAADDVVDLSPYEKAQGKKTR